MTVGFEGKLALTINELVEATSLSRTRIYEEIRNGRLTVTKCGRRSLIRVETARAWLQALEKGKV